MTRKAIVKTQRKQQITEEICVANSKSLKCLLQNLEIEENDDRFQEVMTSDETVTLFSEGGLKTEGGFG